MHTHTLTTAWSRPSNQAGADAVLLRHIFDSSGRLLRSDTHPHQVCSVAHCLSLSHPVSTSSCSPWPCPDNLVLSTSNLCLQKRGKDWEVWPQLSWGPRCTHNQSVFSLHRQRRDWGTLWREIEAGDVWHSVRGVQPRHASACGKEDHSARVFQNVCDCHVTNMCFQAPPPLVCMLCDKTWEGPGHEDMWSACDPLCCLS